MEHLTSHSQQCEKLVCTVFQELNVCILSQLQAQQHHVDNLKVRGFATWTLAKAADQGVLFIYLFSKSDLPAYHLSGVLFQV